MVERRQVILVGHCGPDTHMLKSAISRALPHVQIAHANDEGKLKDHLSPDSLLLINRVLDGAFSFDSGIGLIEMLSKHSPAPRMMLISNFPEAQQRAVQAGAMPGFGKTQLYNDATAQLLRNAIAIDTRVQ
jgi:ActR/RegA family two-component response regulator